MAKNKGPVELPVAIGQVIAGRYVIERVIGQGGMGIVLGGRHMELGEKVAIKFLHREHASFADRFFREARAAARIRSEHVVRVFDVGRLPAGEPYLVMEFLEGEDLDTRVERLGRLDIQFVADTLLDVCQALAEAHASGIVHRDLKPANIFLAKTPGRDSLVKLLDFGVAKVPDAGAITKTASMLGSPIYMSPEQLLATRDVDARSDIWSLGIILYELLTGEYPFEGDSLVHLAMVIREKRTPSVRDLRPEVPEGLDAVIQRCLEKDRNLRFRDVGEFAQALVDFASPAVSHSVSRIKRIVEEKKERLALASTEAEEGDDEGAEHDETAAVDSQEGRRNTKASSGNNERASSGRSPVSHSVAAGSSPLVSPLTASLAAVSTSTSDPSAEGKRRRVRIAAVVLGGVCLIGLGVVGRVAFGPGKSGSSSLETGGSLVSEAAALPPSSTAVPLLVASSTSSVASPPPAPASTTPAPVASPPTGATTARIAKPIATPAKSVTTAASAPSAPPPESCDPPWTIDENGIKRLKKQCK